MSGLRRTGARHAGVSRTEEQQLEENQLRETGVKLEHTTERLFTYLVRDELHQWPTETLCRWSTVVLLVSALVNTLLLAYLFKATQLDDRGLMAGKVGLAAAGSTLQGPAQITGKLSLYYIQQPHHSRTPLTLTTNSIAKNSITPAPINNTHLHTLSLKATQQLQFRLTNKMATKRPHSDAPSSSLLLTFNSTSQQLNLANQRQLKLVSRTSNSLTTAKYLETSKLEAAPGKPLELQAAQSTLVFQNTPDNDHSNMRLVARAGQVTLSSSAEGQVSIDAPVLRLSAAKGVRLQSGLHYYDSPLPHAMARRHQPDIHLAAHTVLAINGFLMASAI